VPYIVLICVFKNVDIEADCHRELPLPLFELRVLFVDDVQFAFAANDLAVRRTLLDGRSDFHILSRFSNCRFKLTCIGK
jgi:hypothetical protein